MMRWLIVLVILSQTFVVNEAFCAEALKNLNKDYWLGVYSNQHKIGYVHFTLGRGKFDGKDVYKQEETVRFKVRQNGEDYRIDFDHTLYLDDELERIYETVEGRSSDPSQLPNMLEITYGWKTATMKLTSEGKKQESVLPYTGRYHDVTLAGSLYSTGAKALVVGDKIEASYFRLMMSPENGANFQLNTGNIEILKQEKLVMDGVTYNTFVVKDGSSNDEITRWQLPNGEIIKQVQSSDQVTFIHETKQKATEINASNTIDIDAIPCDSAPKSNSYWTEADIKFIGITDSSFVKSDARQSGKYVADHQTAEYHTIMCDFNPRKAISLPVSDKKYSDYLANNPGLELNDIQLQKLSADTLKGEKNACKAADKLLDWINKNVTYKRNAAVDLSSIAIIKARMGDCKHYALLYTALARSAGIPTRLVTGLAYDHNTLSFLKHSWVESYVGEWIALDPSTECHLVSAEYIKFFESANPEIFSSEFHTLGIKAEVINCKTIDNANAQ